MQLRSTIDSFALAQLVKHPFDQFPAPLLRFALTEEEAAASIGISKDFLSKLRRRGEAPPHRRIGDRVVYPIDGLRAWLLQEDGEVSPTAVPKFPSSASEEDEPTQQKRTRGRPRKLVVSNKPSPPLCGKGVGG